jgi:UDP-glucose 4-epimerase
MMSALRAGQGRRAGLLPVPPALLAAACQAMGRADDWQRLGGSQEADPQKLLDVGWRPTIDTRAGLAALMRTNMP